MLNLWQSIFHNEVFKSFGHFFGEFRLDLKFDVAFLADCIKIDENFTQICVELIRKTSDFG